MFFVALNAKQSQTFSLFSVFTPRLHVPIALESMLRANCCIFCPLKGAGTTDRNLKAGVVSYNDVYDVKYLIQNRDFILYVHRDSCAFLHSIYEAIVAPPPAVNVAIKLACVIWINWISIDACKEWTMFEEFSRQL